MTKVQTIVSTLETLTPTQQAAVADLLSTLIEGTKSTEVFKFTEEELTEINRRLTNMHKEKMYTIDEVFASL